MLNRALGEQTSWNWRGMRVGKRELLLDRSKPGVEMQGELKPILQQVDALESSW